MKVLVISWIVIVVSYCAVPADAVATNGLSSGLQQIWSGHGMSGKVCVEIYNPSTGRPAQGSVLLVNSEKKQRLVNGRGITCFAVPYDKNTTSLYVRVDSGISAVLVSDHTTPYVSFELPIHENTAVR